MDDVSFDFSFKHEEDFNCGRLEEKMIPGKKKYNERVSNKKINSHLCKKRLNSKHLL